MPTPRPLSRRSLLVGGAATVAAWSVANLTRPAFAQTGGLAYPFTLGVASGDPNPDGVVLWTRLAPQPLNDDGLGGMPDRVYEVEWQIAKDEQFNKTVQNGVELAAPDLGHSVHVEPAGLDAGTEYFYRFKVDGHISAIGRTRTAPKEQSMGPPLTICFASCSHFGNGYFTAYRHMANDQPDLMLHLGDYQYEGPAGAADIRPVLGPETFTLANYRQRHAQYKSDPDLQLAHATAPWLVVFDDHELENNWADEIAEPPQPNFPARRHAAFQAYYENMPLRLTSKPNGIDMQLYRRVRWGSLATFHMLDTRQYRDDQLLDDTDRYNPSRTITGADQEAWLLDGLHESGTRWDVLGQQVFFAQRDLAAGAAEDYSQDAWDGYAAQRDRITQGWIDRATRNPVVLTGDVHRHYAAEIKQNYEDPAAPSVGVELVATSISTTGDGNDDPNLPLLQDNPHIKFFKNRRGYVRTTFTGGEMTVDFQVLPFVTQPDAPVQTSARFIVEDGNPVLNAG